jgi:hypothetical protein
MVMEALEGFSERLGFMYGHSLGALSPFVCILLQFGSRAYLLTQIKFKQRVREKCGFCRICTSHCRG